MPPLRPQEPFTNAEVRALVAACRTDQECAAIRMLADCGLRATETRTLAAGAINWKEGLVTVLGKGGKWREMVVSKAALAALRFQVNGSAWVFESQHHRGQPISYARIRQIVQQVGKRAKIPNASPHKFRRSYASRFLESGGDIGALRYALGHSTLAMSIHYASATERRRSMKHQRRLADRL